jgi:GH24 family phage-related lysozyme (muramidase)
MLYQSIRAWLIRWEGYCPYWYQDSVGVVTIGIGLAYPQPGNCAIYGEGAIGSWQRVHDSSHGMTASWYACVTPWRADEGALEREFERRVLGFYGALRQHFADYDSWPEPAKIATFDLAYNAGASLAGWPRFCAAVADHDWARAAVECVETRGNPDQHRNAARSALFKSLGPPEAA